MAAHASSRILALQHHDHRVPPQDVFQTLLKFKVARVFCLLRKRNGVQVRRIDVANSHGQLLSRAPVAKTGQDFLHALGAITCKDVFQGLSPLLLVQFDVGRRCPSRLACLRDRV